MILADFYKAWKSGQKEIVLTIDEFNEMLMSPHTDNEKIDFEDHRECPSIMHEIDMITRRDVLMIGHYATYRDILKIMVRKKIDD